MGIPFVLLCVAADPERFIFRIGMLSSMMIMMGTWWAMGQWLIRLGKESSYTGPPL
jgi:hypothetical protein